LRKRIDDCLAILEGHLLGRSFVAAEKPTVADISMGGYLSFPKHESGYDLAATHRLAIAFRAGLWQTPQPQIAPAASKA
jgi:glutathione S-transferase